MNVWQCLDVLDSEVDLKQSGPLRWHHSRTTRWEMLGFVGWVARNLKTGVGQTRPWIKAKDWKPTQIIYLSLPYLNLKVSTFNKFNRFATPLPHPGSEFFINFILRSCDWLQIAAFQPRLHRWSVFFSTCKQRILLPEHAWEAEVCVRKPFCCLNFKQGKRTVSKNMCLTDCLGHIDVQRKPPGWLTLLISLFSDITKATFQ